MNKKQFDEVVQAILSRFNNGQDGWYSHKGRYVTHKHILYLPEICKTDKEVFIKKQKEIVFNYGLTSLAKIYPFYLDGHLHPLAHHLTSSQIMCYNFFRPLINDKGIPVDVDASDITTSLVRLWESLALEGNQEPYCIPLLGTN